MTGESPPEPYHGDVRRRVREDGLSSVREEEGGFVVNLKRARAVKVEPAATAPVDPVVPVGSVCRLCGKIGSQMSPASWVCWPCGRRWVNL